jgi:hypothetical protein
MDPAASTCQPLGQVVSAARLGPIACLLAGLAGNYSRILKRNESAAAGRDLRFFPAITARHIQSEFPRPPAIHALQG